MATDLARTIVSEARLQHRSEMSKIASQSTAVLKLKSLKCRPNWGKNIDDYEYDDYPEIVKHLVDDVFLSSVELGKSANGKLVLKGAFPAFEILDTHTVAVVLAQQFLIHRYRERKQHRRNLESEPNDDFEIDREQLEYGQMYIQLLRDELEDAAPLFSLQSNLKVENAVPQIQLIFQLYLAGNFLKGEEGKPTVPLPERKYRPWHQYMESE